MAEAETPAPRSSLLYAMGQLTAETKAHAAEISRMREQQEGLPEKVIAALTPQLSAIQGTLARHDTRIGSLERRQWLVWGGGTTVLALVGYLIKIAEIKF